MNFLRISLAAIFVLILSGCYEDQKRKEFEAAGCTWISKEEQTDQPKKYCGKACFRYVQREYFRCGEPGHYSLTYFEY